MRRLAAILAADVVGYSRLMGRDESGTLARLRTHRRNVLEPMLASHGGRLVKLVGDGALAEFMSAVDAVSAAIAIQHATAETQAGQPPDTAIVLRIGVHLGDLIVDGDDLYGDGVNVAARLESAAPPGGIFVSGDVHNAVLGRLKATFHGVGDLTLKNIERTVPAFRVAWDDASLHQPRAAAPAVMPRETPALAVLPFTNMSGDAEQEYFTDGVTEDIITALSRFRELVVISRGSSFAFKGKDLDLRRVAEQLGARYVLSGSMRRAANRIRVSAELTDATSGVQVWSDRYDRAMADLFDLQDDISRSVAAVVDPAIRSAEIERARRKPPASLSAYDLYLRALPHLWASTREDIPKAIELLRRSVSLDSTRAPAHAALALSLGLASPAGAGSMETAAEAVSVARRAVELDSADAFAQSAYAYALIGVLRDVDQARLHAREAVRLNPSSAFAWGVMGAINSMTGGFDAALDELNRALSLSPFDNLQYLWMQGLAASCFGLGRFEDGAAWARRSLQRNPGHGTSHRLLAANLAAAGRLQEARDVTRLRDASQQTTIRELRALGLFRPDDVLERYLAAQRLAGVPE